MSDSTTGSTERLYWRDPGLDEFEAIVIEARSGADGRGEVILDRTAFYPESGGQPADRGRLAGARVVDVQERGDLVVHTIEGDLPAVGAHVTGCIDAERRERHCCLHTAQHIVSAIAETQYDAATVGFHVGDQRTTVDLAGDRIDAESLRVIEDEANRVVREARAVTTRLEAGGEVRRGERREHTDAELRIVAIDGFDRNACCGTHVANTAAIGAILLGRTERAHGATRVELFAGRQAIAEHDRLRQIVGALIQATGAGAEELETWISSATRQLKELRRELDRARADLASGEAERLLATAEERDGLKVLTTLVSPRDGSALRKLGLDLAGRDGVVAAVGAENGDKAHLLVCRSRDVELDVRPILAELAIAIGARGGGRPELSQAGGGDPAKLAQALDRAAEILASTLEESTGRGGDK